MLLSHTANGIPLQAPDVRLPTPEEINSLLHGKSLAEVLKLNKSGSSNSTNGPNSPPGPNVDRNRLKRQNKKNKRDSAAIDNTDNNSQKPSKSQKSNSPPLPPNPSPTTKSQKGPCVNHVANQIALPGHLQKGPCNPKDGRICDRNHYNIPTSGKIPKGIVTQLINGVSGFNNKEFVDSFKQIVNSMSE
jgi:hypothetical protein